MDYSKLNALAATRVMGWRCNPAVDMHWFGGNGIKVHINYWNPATDLNDAIKTLLKVSAAGFMLDCDTRMGDKEHPDFHFMCSVPYIPEELSWAATAPLAMTLCALRASGVTEEEIQAAMEET